MLERAGSFHVITDDIVTGIPASGGVLDIGPNTDQEVNAGMLAEPGNVQQAIDAEYVPNPAAVAAKNEKATLLQSSVGLHMAQLATQAPNSATFTGVTPATDSLGEGEPQSVALGILLYRQEPNFCGPDSTAIVTMMDNQADYGFNFQYTVADKMGYQDNGPDNYPGTSYPSVQKWLNYYTNIVYNAQKPGDPTQLMSWIVNDTWNYGNDGIGIVNDVQPEDFDYWSGYSSPHGHYNVTRGYDERGGGYAQVGDEFDPSYRNGKRPYGFHLVPITTLYNAISDSPAPYEIW